MGPQLKPIGWMTSMLFLADWRTSRALILSSRSKPWDLAPEKSVRRLSLPRAENYKDAERFLLLLPIYENKNKTISTLKKKKKKKNFLNLKKKKKKKKKK